MATGDKFFTCVNNQQIPSWESFYASLIIEDENGNPCLKTSGSSGGGGGLPPVGIDTYSNIEISGNIEVTTANTYKSIELLVFEGVVVLDNITYPEGSYRIEATFNNKIANSLSYDASNSTSSFLQYMV
jgi:hypothetical protein